MLGILSVSASEPRDLRILEGLKVECSKLTMIEHDLTFKKVENELMEAR